VSDKPNNADIVVAIEQLTAELAKLREAVVQLSQQPKSPASALVDAIKKVAVVPDEPDPEISYHEIYGLVAATFMAAMDDDDENGFEAFLKLIHSDRTGPPRSIPSLREFTWRSLKNNLSSYLQEAGDSTSFEVVRRDPESIDTGTVAAKVFLKSAARSPVPIVFKRDPSQELAWRITDCSL
jgi:hypothetical protein